MAALQHYALREDSSGILRDLLDQGYVVVPEDPVLTKPELVRYSKYSPEIELRLDNYPCLLIEGSFTRHPLHFDRRETGTAAGTYSVSESVGPRIRWCQSRFRSSAKPTLSLGSVGHLSSYRNPTTNTWDPVSRDVKTAFKAIVQIFKRHMERVQIGKERVWVGRCVKRSLDEGTVFIER